MGRKKSDFVKKHEREVSDYGPSDRDDMLYGNELTEARDHNPGTDQRVQRLNERTAGPIVLPKLLQLGILVRDEPGPGELQIVRDHKVRRGGLERELDVNVKAPTTRLVTPIMGVFYNADQLVIYIEKGDDYAPLPLPDVFTSVRHPNSDFMVGLHYIRNTETNRALYIVRRDYPYSVLAAVRLRPSSHKSNLLSVTESRPAKRAFAKTATYETGISGKWVDRSRLHLYKQARGPGLVDKTEELAHLL